MKEEIISANENILKIIFGCLVRNGVENTTMRTICNETGMNASSLYYRLYYGLNSVTKELFWVAAEKINNFQELLIAFIKNVDARKQSIRLIYQVLGSPKYGDNFKKMTHSGPKVIYKYTEMLSDKLKCSTEELMPYVELTIAVIREYAIWEYLMTTKL